MELILKLIENRIITKYELCEKFGEEVMYIYSYEIGDIKVSGINIDDIIYNAETKISDIIRKKKEELSLIEGALSS